MANTITEATALDQLIDIVTKLGRKFTGTATASGATLTTTDPEINKMGSAADTSRFQTGFLYIPSATGADIVHSITTLSVSGATATITTLGNYASTYTSATMYLLALHPADIRNLFNDALALEFTGGLVPLRHGPASADMQGSSVDSDWTESGATDTVQTTASEVFWGAQSLVVTDSGSGGDYTQSALSPIGQGERVYAFGIVKSDVGTSVLQVLDGDSNVQGSISTTQEDYVFMRKEVTFDAADELIRLRLAETTASASGDWQAAWYVKAGMSLFRLPTWLDRRFEVRGLAWGEFMESGAEDDTWLAESIDLHALTQSRGGIRGDFRFMSHAYDANPSYIWVDPKWLDKPLFLTVRMPYSAPYGVSTLFSATDLTSTTACSLPVLMARSLFLMSERYAAFEYLQEKAIRDIRLHARLDETAPVPQQTRRRAYGRA